MRRRPAHPQSADGRAVASPTRRGPVEEELLEGELALEDVALGEAGHALHVERREYLFVDDAIPDARGELRDRVDDRIPEGVALGVPVARRAVELIRRVLDEAAHNVLA